MALSNECLGSPIGYNGGELEFCNAPTISLRRFCDRCHIIAIRDKLKRVESLKRRLEQAESDLAALLEEGNCGIVE